MIVHSNSWIWGKTWMFILEGGKALVGAEKLPEDRHVFLHGLSVLPEERNKGLATKLLEQVQDFFSKEGIQEFRLKAERNNEQLLEFYSKRGWKVLDLGYEDQDEYCYFVKITPK